VAREDTVQAAGARYAALVVGPSLELGEVDLRREGSEVAVGERVALEAVAPPRRVGEGTRVDDRLIGLTGPEGDVEEGGRRRQPTGAAGHLGARARAGDQVAAGASVPQADAGRHADHVATGVPRGVPDAQLNLAAAQVDLHARSRRNPLARDGVAKLSASPVPGEEERGR
jgi:hypothetical protein